MKIEQGKSDKLSIYQIKKIEEKTLKQTPETISLKALTSLLHWLEEMIFQLYNGGLKYFLFYAKSIVYILRKKNSERKMKYFIPLV